MSENSRGSSNAENKWFLLEVTTAAWWVGFGCVAEAQVSPRVSAVVLPAGGFPCCFLTDLMLLVEGSFPLRCLSALSAFCLEDS